MPLKVVVELQIHAVSCPGVYLTEKNDVYLHVCILGQCKETESLRPVFPLWFHEKMWFEKVFEKATDPVAVVEMLERNVTKFRLVEVVPSGKGELAFYEENTRGFLFPVPKLTPTYPGVDRELLMKTRPFFPGIAPKLEFSTRTTITELPLLSRRWYRGRNKSRLRRALSASPRRRSISPARCSISPARCRTMKKKGCRRFSRSSPSRSPSPTRRLPEFCPESQQQTPSLSLRSVKFKSESESDPRPPFVVRHVDSSKMFSTDSSKMFSEPRSPYWNPSKNGSSSRNSHKLQLKRALSYDSWKSACPAAKVTRELDMQYSLDPGSSSLETREPIDFDHSLSLCHKPSSDSSKRYRSPSPCARWASPQHRIYSSPNSSWEEINERVKNLLTSDDAIQRLSFGATDSEIDDVLERRSISLRSSPLCDSTDQRYWS
ncbi:spermatogenesis associated 6-like protein isoform X1 [Zootoca vivipara]|uniref:spermatogenesis associated 6-like protein isoform X1 n=1 Tax=Zootoca vivipara TaxID=8524 RepID=UPI00293C1150|nr:spermatogenesis associated 6-like protein isoform X1 [Zootoca vivipara]